MWTSVAWLCTILNCGHQEISKPPGFGVAQHVLLIGVDGLGGMYLENATKFLPNFDKLMRGGAYTTHARGVTPAVSGPNWGAILTSMGPTECGIVDNGWTPSDTNPSDPTSKQLPPISGSGRIPETMWRVAKNAGGWVQTAVSISWDWLRYLAESETVDHLFRGHEDDAEVTKQMGVFIRSHKPNLMFIHLDAVDGAGHRYGWGSPQYYDAVKIIDGHIGTLLEALEVAGILSSTTVIVTADHGGVLTSHGDFNEANAYIPGIFWGAGVYVQGALPEEYYVAITDFAPTALHALGLPPGRFMRGRVASQAFEPPRSVP